jgi:hypothetical protein
LGVVETASNNSCNLFDLATERNQKTECLKLPLAQTAVIGIPGNTYRRTFQEGEYMPEPHTPIHKTHPSGSWRVVRSMAVPANVTQAHANQSLNAHQSGTRKVQKIEEESVLLKPRRAPGYFETSNHLFSKS